MANPEHEKVAAYVEAHHQYFLEIRALWKRQSECARAKDRLNDALHGINGLVSPEYPERAFRVKDDILLIAHNPNSADPRTVVFNRDGKVIHLREEKRC